jgi:hypothetical protein
MSLSNYLQLKRRNQAKKMIRKKKPYLMGARLEDEVDRVLGIADSGKMDWVTLVEGGKEASEYSSIDSITYQEVLKTAHEYKVRPYILYWMFHQKALKLEASGRNKHDYLALLKTCAASAAKKNLSDSEKKMAAYIYSKNLKGIEIPNLQLDMMIANGEL